MAEHPELSPVERYELMKLKMLNEVQGELLQWARRRLWLLFVALAVVGYFGVSGFISFTVGQSIEKKMESVNGQIFSAIKSSVEAELAARQATKSAETETKRVNDTVTKLRESLENISKDAAKTEDQLRSLSKSLESQSENVRGESRLVTSALEQRMESAEKLIQKLATTVGAIDVSELVASISTLEAKAKLEKEQFIENSKFEIQIIYDEKSQTLVSQMQTTLRKYGFRTSTWRSIYETEHGWGVALASLGSTITILSPPKKDFLGDKISRILSSDLGISEAKLGTDQKSITGFAVGVLIPPGYGRESLTKARE